MAPPVLTPSVQLPPEAVAAAATEARKEGIFAGLTAALASGEYIRPKVIGTIIKFLWSSSYWGKGVRTEEVPNTFQRCTYWRDLWLSLHSGRQEKFIVIAPVNTIPQAFHDTHMARLEREARKLEAQKKDSSSL
ncbi:hypothetical protein D9758_011630 [Tetrapyrgos nigripes]|uniref:Uncharacterized protein n=1 Tax=Tetrapyrgos nigripes TaxID=182062 RepID=A0A8H5CU04_9AGAR|nr:hypothetical protein D9758_011630 [Tetrapyrgos nigripes]